MFNINHRTSSRRSQPLPPPLYFCSSTSPRAPHRARSPAAPALSGSLLSSPRCRTHARAPLCVLRALAQVNPHAALLSNAALESADKHFNFSLTGGDVPLIGSVLGVVRALLSQGYLQVVTGSQRRIVFRGSCFVFRVRARAVRVSAGPAVFVFVSCALSRCVFVFRTADPPGGAVFSAAGRRGVAANGGFRATPPECNRGELVTRVSRPVRRRGGAVERAFGRSGGVARGGPRESAPAPACIRKTPTSRRRAATALLPSSVRSID